MTSLACEILDPQSVSNDDVLKYNPLRVMQVINGEHYAGAERVQDLLALNMAANGIEGSFFCVKPARFPHERRASEMPLWSAKMLSRFDLRPARKLAKLVREQKIDVIHAHGARAGMIAALAARWTKTPLVYHVHGQTAVEVGGSWISRARTRLNAWLERKILASCSAVVAVSESVAKYIRSVGAAADRVIVVPNGVPARISKTEDSQSEIFSARRFPLNQMPMLGFVALLRPRKGLEVFLDAAAKLTLSGMKFKLRVVGRFENQEYEEEIKQRCRDLNIEHLVDWRGFCQPIDPELDAMDLLVFPSILAEGMPMVLLEAMASGLPIVATRVAGTTDVIEHGRTGLLVEPNESVPLAEAITCVLNSPALWEQLSENGRAAHKLNYSDKVMADRMAKLYRTVLTQA